MEKTRHITIVFLLALAVLTPVVQAKSPALLLREGIYAEETEGDLDKAIGLYEQVLEEYREVERLGVRATYQLGMCHLKKGDKTKAAEYFQEVVTEFAGQKAIVKKADEQLKKVKPETKESVFEQIDYQVTRFLGEQFGETALEAGQKNLSVNSHIYYVDLNGFRYQGGMNAFYNWTGRTITQKVRFGGTSYPNQTHYGVDGHELNTEIVPDKTRPNHWQIYWKPDEPLAPEEHLYYGWSMNNKRKTSKLPGDVYSLTMQNKYGSPVIETFFLVLPKELKISQSNPPTGSQELLNFNVYWWTKTVQQGENHVERVQLKKAEIRYTFGPVIEKNINEGAVGEACAFDLDTAKAFSFPRGFSGSTPWEKGIRWILENAIDFGNCAGRLQLFDMIAVEVEDKMWDSADAVEINSILMKGSSKEFLPTDREEYTITDPCTYAFKTREGGIGLLQILEKRTTYLKIRYKMLQKEIAGVREKDKLQAEELTAEGWKLWGQRKLAEAEGKFKEAIAKNPEADGAYQGLGWAQLNQGKKLNAKDSFEKCVKLNPKNSAALNGLGWIAHGQGNIDEAISWWEKAVEAQPGATAALNGLTQVYMEKKEYDKAIKYYKMWLKAEPNNKQAKEGLKKARASNRN